MEEYLPFVSIDTWTIIMSWGNLLILFLLLRHFLFNRINNMLGERAREIEDTYKNAENAKASAQKTLLEYQEKLRTADTEADGIIKSAVETANLRSDGIVGEAMEKSRNIIDRAQKQIERDKEAAINKSRADIAEIAVETAKKLIEKEFHANDDERFISDIIDKI